jgi:hypothetical protein
MPNMAKLQAIVMQDIELVAPADGLIAAPDKNMDVCKLFHDVLIRSCVIFSCLFPHCPYLLCVCACACPCASPGGCGAYPMTIGTTTNSHVYSSRQSMSIFP